MPDVIEQRRADGAAPRAGVRRHAAMPTWSGPRRAPASDGRISTASWRRRRWSSAAPLLLAVAPARRDGARRPRRRSSPAASWTATSASRNAESCDRGPPEPLHDRCRAIGRWQVQASSDEHRRADREFQRRGMSVGEMKPSISPATISSGITPSTRLDRDRRGFGERVAAAAGSPGASSPLRHQQPARRRR